MASRFWVGGTGNWSDNTNHWSASSGGAAGASKPGVGDTALFGVDSGGGVCTVDEDVSVASIFISNYTNGTFDANDFNITCSTIFAFDGTEVRTLRMGNGIWTLSGTGTIWRGSATNLTMDAEGSTIDCTEPSAGSRTLTCASVPINHLKVSAGTGSVSLSNTICNDLDWTGFAGSWASSTITISGNLTIASGMVVTAGSSTITMSATSSKNITPNGVTIDRPITLNGVGGTWTLQGNLTMGSARSLTLTNGSLNANDKDISCGNFLASNSNVRSVTMGSGTWTINSTTGWSLGTSTNMTLTPGTSTIKLTNILGCFFRGGGLTYNNIWCADASAETFEIEGSNTFNDFKIDAGRSVEFDEGKTQTVNTFDAVGTAGSLITLLSQTPGTQWYISKASGTVNCDYLSLQDSYATGGAVWNAGANSLDVSNNDGWNIGWTFVSKPTGSSYTSIAKPTGAVYTNINTQGKEQYDQPSLIFDDSSVYYDGVQIGAYTNISKP